MSSLFASISKAVAVLGLSILAAISATSAPTASFDMATHNPAAGYLVQFTDTSSGSPTAWAWDFGDGATSTEQNPSHLFATAGNFTVRLTASNPSGSSNASLAITVTPNTVLRLNPAHTFDLTLSARDPRTGNTGNGTVIGQNDVYGYFSIPAVSGNAGNPEVIVKMVDATGIGQNYWVFYGCMTDLEYTLSVQENATGLVKTYSKDAGKPCGQFDTSGFLPTPTPTQGPAVTVTPTPTATPTGPQTISLRARQFEWNWNLGGSSVVLQVGTTYTIQITDIDPAGRNSHGFSGVPELGLAGGKLTAGGGSILTRTFTPTSSQVGFHAFSCSESTCGDGHDNMLGTIQIVP
jgi:PKD repeat protein